MGNENTSLKRNLHIDYKEVGKNDILTSTSSTTLKGKEPSRSSGWVVVKSSQMRSRVWKTSRVKGYPRIKFSKNESGLSEANESFTQIKRLKIKIPHEQEIWGQLVEIPQMAIQLSEACRLSRDEFPDSELSLEMFYDPESEDQYPILYIRQQVYEKDIMSRIENIMEEFEWYFVTNMGWFLITTDFQSIK